MSIVNALTEIGQGLASTLSTIIGSISAVFFSTGARNNNKLNIARSHGKLII